LLLLLLEDIRQKHTRVKNISETAREDLLYSVLKFVLQKFFSTTSLQYWLLKVTLASHSEELRIH